MSRTYAHKPGLTYGRPAGRSYEVRFDGTPIGSVCEQDGGWSGPIRWAATDLLGRRIGTYDRRDQAGAALLNHSRRRAA